jgi:bifunctional non-homologous end joining protein LigD
VAEDPGQVVEVGGHRLVLRNLDKVLYPDSGTTKGEVLAYYMAVAEHLLPHAQHRPLTRKRWPNGVAGQSFFEKNVPQGTPDWVRTVVLPVPGSTMGRETIDFPLLDDLATLIWLGNLAALELHVPQWTVGPRGGVRDPNRLVIDLDPGAPAGIAECAEVAVLVRERLADDGLEAYPVTSGSKGMQLYAAVSGTQDADVIRDYAKRLAESLEKTEKLVVSRMTKALRPGKVLLDWSQNNAAKTTICPYSMRGRDLPHVATPVTWDELAEDPRQFRFDEVMARVAEHGDLLAGRCDPGPKVPTG